MHRAVEVARPGLLGTPGLVYWVEDLGTVSLSAVSAALTFGKPNLVLPLFPPEQNQILAHEYSAGLQLNLGEGHGAILFRPPWSTERP